MRLARWGLVVLLLAGIMVGPSARPAAAAGPCDIVSGWAAFKWTFVHHTWFPVGPQPYDVVVGTWAMAEVADPGCRVALYGRVTVFDANHSGGSGDQTGGQVTPCLPSRVGSSVRCTGAVYEYGHSSALPPVRILFVARVDGVGPNGEVVKDTAHCWLEQSQRSCALIT